MVDLIDFSNVARLLLLVLLCCFVLVLTPVCLQHVKPRLANAVQQQAGGVVASLAAAKDKEEVNFYTHRLKKLNGQL